jgi:hypothetical protein
MKQRFQAVDLWRYTGDFFVSNLNLFVCNCSGYTKSILITPPPFVIIQAWGMRVEIASNL